MTIGTGLIHAERERQIEGEGWTEEHDDKHCAGEMALAAVCFASPVKLHVFQDTAHGYTFFDPWPWAIQWDKRFCYGERKENPGNVVPDPKTYTPEERLDLLVKAGALIAAEIDLFSRKKENVPVVADYCENLPVR